VRTGRRRRLRNVNSALASTSRTDVAFSTANRSAELIGVENTASVPLTDIAVPPASAVHAPPVRAEPRPPAATVRLNASDATVVPVTGGGVVDVDTV
jgi:hypothetical protein